MEIHQYWTYHFSSFYNINTNVGQTFGVLFLFQDCDWTLVLNLKVYFTQLWCRQIWTHREDNRPIRCKEVPVVQREVSWNWQHPSRIDPKHTCERFKRNMAPTWRLQPAQQPSQPNSSVRRELVWERSLVHDNIMHNIIAACTLVYVHC